MKKLILSIALAVICFTGYSQTNETASSTNTATATDVFTDWVQEHKSGLLDASRYSVALYGTYAPDVPEGEAQFGYGAAVGYSASENVRLVFCYDQFGDEATAVSGSLTFQLPTKPFAKWGWDLEVIPTVFIGTGTAVGGTGGENGGAILITGAGISTKLASFDVLERQATVSAFYLASHWEGVGVYDGMRHHLGAAFSIQLEKIQ